MYHQDVYTTIAMDAAGKTRQEIACCRVYYFQPGELTQNQVNAINQAMPNSFQFLADGSGRSWAPVNIEEVKDIIANA